MATCPRGTNLDPQSGYCISQCSPGYVYLTGDCVQQCPPNMNMNDQKICIRPTFSRSMFVNDNPSQKSFIVFGMENNSVTYGAFSNETKNIEFDQPMSTLGPVKQVLPQNNNSFWLIEDQRASNEDQESFNVPVQTFTGTLGNSFENVNPVIASATGQSLVPEIRKAVYMPTRDQMLTISDSTPSQVQLYNVNGSSITNGSIVYDENQMTLDEILYFTGGTPTMDTSGNITTEGRAQKGSIKANNVLGTSYFDYTTSIQSRNGGGFVISGKTNELDFNYVVFQDPDTTVHKVSNGHTITQNVLRVDQHDVNDTTRYLLVSGDQTDEPVNVLSYVEESNTLTNVPVTDIYSTEVVTTAYDALSNMALFSFNNPSNASVVTYTYTYDTITSSQLDPDMYGTATSMEIVNMANEPKNWTYATLDVPANCSNIHVIMWGAGGSADNEPTNTGTGGAGAFVEGDINPTKWQPGQQMRILVGAGGLQDTYNFPINAFGGGGAGSEASSVGQGGGLARIQTYDGSKWNDIVVGAGGGSTGNGIGGASGQLGQTGNNIYFGSSGTDETNNNPPGTNAYGGGGSLSSGGSGGSGGAINGAQYQGGDTLIDSTSLGYAGGGSGYYGGGGASDVNYGAGGGSSYVANLNQTSMNFQPGNNYKAPMSNHPLYVTGIAKGGQAQTGNGIGFPEGGNALVIVQFTVKATSPSNPGTDTFGRNVVYTTKNSWMFDMESSSPLLKDALQVLTFETKSAAADSMIFKPPAGIVHSMAIFSTKTGITPNGIVVMAMEMTADQWLSTSGYSPGSLVEYEGITYQAIIDVAPNSDPPPNALNTSWYISSSTQLYYAPFTFNGTTISIPDNNMLVLPQNENPMASITKVAIIPSSQSTFVFMGSGVRIARFQTGNTSGNEANSDWQWSTGLVKNIPDFDTTFIVTDGAYESQRGVFTIAARPKMINVSMTLQNNYIAQFEDTNACKYATDGGNIIVAIGGPLLTSTGTSITQSEYQIRYTISNGTYGSVPELYYQGNQVTNASGGSIPINNLLGTSPNPNPGPLILDDINARLAELSYPNFTLRSPANILVSTDKGKHFKPIRDGTTRSKISPYVYTLFEGYNNDNNKTDVVPLNGSTPVIMKSQFTDITYLPLNKTAGYFIAVGSYLWDLNTFGSGTLPSVQTTGTILGPNVIWICNSSDPELWFPKTLTVTNKSAQSTDNFWNVLSCTYDEVSKQIFLATDFAMYTFDDTDIQASFSTNTIECRMLAFLPPYGAVCFERDAENQCVACPTGSYNEVINISRTNETPTPTNICLYASSLQIANETANIYNGFPQTGIQHLTAATTYFQMTSVSMLVGLWGSGGGNPGQDTTANSGGSGAYISGIINRDSIMQKYNTTDPWLICVIDYGKVASGTINSSLYGIGGGLTGIFWDPQNGSNQGNPDLSHPIIIAGGGGGGGSKISQSLGGFGGITKGGDATSGTSGINGIGGDNTNFDNNFSVSQMLSKIGSNANGASSGAGFLAGTGGTGGNGGGGGTSFMDIDICTPLESEDGNAVENYGGAIAFPGGLSSPLYVLPAGQTGQQGLISYILQDGLNTFYVPLQGNLTFIGLCPKNYTVYSPANDQELFCRLDECLTARKQNADGNYVGLSDNTLVWSNTFSSTGSNTVMQICLQNALSGSLPVLKNIFKKAIVRPALPSQTEILPSYQNDNDPNQEHTISTITWQKSSQYPKNDKSNSATLDQMFDEQNVSNWTNGVLGVNEATNFGYVLVSNQSKQRFVAPGVGNICISDIQNAMDTLISKYGAIVAFNAYQTDGTTNVQTVLPIQGYLPTYYPPGAGAITQYQCPNDFLRSFSLSMQIPKSILAVPFTLKNYTNVDSNAKRLMSTNFFRPRNWAFNFSYVDDGTGTGNKALVDNLFPEGTTDIPTYSLVSDQPDENDNNEFLYPDPMNVWSTTNKGDPYKCIVAAPARAVYYTLDISGGNPGLQLLQGADTAWFGQTPNAEVLYGLTTTTLGGVPYGHDVSETSPHYAFHYFIANDVYKTSSYGTAAPNIGSSNTNSCTLNVFLNVSKLTNNWNFDWTTNTTQTINDGAYIPFGSGPDEATSHTLLSRLLGINANNNLSPDAEFDPMYHFLFTDPTITANTLVNGTPVANQITLATIHHMFYSKSSPSSYCVSRTWNTYSENYNITGTQAAVLMYSKRLMVANVIPSSYNQDWELSSKNFDNNNNFDPTTYTVPLLASSNATKTAFLWYVIDIQFPSSTIPLSIGTTTISSDLWNNKNQIVNASIPTISVENVWVDNQEVAQIAPEMPGTTYADSGPKLSQFMAQPLMLTRYLQDRYQMYNAYYTESDPYRGFPVIVPYYNVHQIFPRPTASTYQGNIEMNTITQNIRLMDPEFFAVPENFANYSGERPCTLNDGYNIGGFKYAALSNPQGSSTVGTLGVYDIFDNILVLGLAPKMSTTITNLPNGIFDAWNRNINTNMNVTTQSRYNALLVEKDFNNNGIRVFFNQSAKAYTWPLFTAGSGLYETMVFQPDGTGPSYGGNNPYWFYTPCVAATFVVHPLDDTVVDNDVYSADRDYMYMVLENPRVQSTNSPYYWAFHIVQTKIVNINNTPTTFPGRIYEDNSGNWIQRDKNIQNLVCPFGNDQNYDGGGYYSFDGGTATDKKYWLTNNATDQTSLPDPSLDATRMQLITSYQAEYISDDPNFVPLPRVLKIPMPKTTYQWDPSQARFAWESQHNGLNNSQTSALWIKVNGFNHGIVDFASDFPDNGSAATFVQGLLQNSIDNNNFKLADTDNPEPDPGPNGNPTANNRVGINLQPGTLNNETVYYIQITVVVQNTAFQQSYYDDMSIDVRMMDPITRQILGLSRINKLFLEYELPYSWDGGTSTYNAYAPDPMYFGPFSDTMVMMTPVIKDPTKSVDPHTNLVPMDDNGTWINSEKAIHKDNSSGFQINFYRSQYDLPTDAVIANMTYNSFSGNTNNNLVADIDNVFSIQKSYANSGALNNIGQTYPADNGAPLTNALTLQSKNNLPPTTLSSYLATQSNGQAFTDKYIDPLGIEYVYYDTSSNTNITIGSVDGGSGDSFLTYRTISTLTKNQNITYPVIGPVTANDINVKLPNYNGLDITNVNAFPTDPNSVPDSEGYTFENFYWIYWPWINSTTYNGNINYLQGRGSAPNYNSANGAINTLDFGEIPKGTDAWWYPTELNRIANTVDTNAQILSACSSKSLYAIDSALMGSSDGLLRVAFIKNGLIGKVSQISSTLTFNKQSVPLNIGPIVQIFQLGVHWFVYSSLNGPYTTYGQRNSETDLVNVNLASLKFGPLFDASGAAFNNTSFNYWSMPMQQDKKTFSPVLFMRKVKIANKEVLLMGDIYDNVLGIFYQGPKIAYACIITSTVTGNNLGTTSIIDAVLVDNGLQIAVTNPQKTITGTSTTSANVLQQILDARSLWTTQKSKKPGMTPTNTVQCNTFTVTSTLVLPDPALGFTNNAEALLEDFGQQMTNDIATGLDSRDLTGYSIGGVYPFDDLNSPLAKNSWANVITINAYHTDVVGSALSQPFSARFDFSINDPYSRITFTPIPGQPGEYTVGISLYFDFVARNFFNMLNNSPSYSQELVITTLGPPATGYIVTNDIAPVGGGSDQNEPKWYRDALMSFKCKHIRYGSTFNIRPQYFYSDYPKNMFSDLIVTKANEIDANVYISDIVYSPETDVAIWIPIGRYAAIPVRMQYNYNTNGFYSPYDSVTAPKFLSNAIVAWNPNTSKFYLAGLGVKDGSRKLWVVSNIVNAGSTKGSTVAPPDNFIEETWTLGGITNTLTDYFTGVTCMDFSTTCEAIGGYLTTNNETVTVVYYKLANSVWQPAQFRQKGLVTAMKFVGFGWYIATWDLTVDNGHNIPKGLSSLWFASSNFTVIAYVDAWNTVDRLSYVNSIDYATQLLKGTCPTGFEPSIEDPNVCYKICPNGYDAFGTSCVLNCPPGYATSSIANQCIPSRYTPNKVQPMKRMVRNAEPVNTNVTEFTAVVPRETNTGNAVKAAVIIPVAAGILGATLFSLFTK